MQYLKANTAATFSVGTLIDTTGLVPDTGRTVTNVTQIVVLKEGGAALTSIIANTFTHLANGVYKQALTAADTNTVGKLDYHLSATTCQPQHREFMVVPANIYDSLLGNDLYDVNIDQINQVSTPANNLRYMATAAVLFTVQAGSSTSVIETNLASAVNTFYVGRTLLFTSGALSGQAAEITAYNGATKEITCSVLTSAPANGDTAVIV